MRLDSFYVVNELRGMGLAERVGSDYCLFDGCLKRIYRDVAFVSDG